MKLSDNSRKVTAYVLLTSCILLGVVLCAKEPIDPFSQVQRMQRGVNIIGYDPLWKDFSQRRFQ